MTDAIEKVARFVWVVGALFVFFYVIVQAASAASHDRWNEGCFWLLLCHMIYSADKRTKT